MQRKYEQLVKDHERLKENSKREKTNWRNLAANKNLGLAANQNQGAMYEAGKTMLNKLNLGGPGNGMNQGLGQGGVM